VVVQDAPAAAAAADAGELALAEPAPAEDDAKPKRKGWWSLTR